MNDIANATAQELTVLDGLAMQARTLRLSINMNMWQLARVFIEAKELVPHGEWGKWLQDNADVSEKTAQDMMAAYRRFGGRPQFETLGRAKTFKLLPLPEGTEERFMEEHDVESMTTREIQEAVKQARAEAQARIDAAEARVRELEEREPVIPQEVTDELPAGRKPRRTGPIWSVLPKTQRTAWPRPYNCAGIRCNWNATCRRRTSCYRNSRKPLTAPRTTF